MRLKVLSLFDAAVEQFDRPFFVRTLAEGERMALASAREPDSHVGKHAADLTLFELAEFESDTGEFFPCAPHAVVSAAAFVQAARDAAKNSME